MSATPPAAAILDDGSTSVDDLLTGIARRERARGRRVHGLLMTYPGGRDDCRGPMVLVDVATDDRYPVSQPLGADSRSCRADPQGFARASRVLRDALGEAELVICNRFGNLEALGEGFSEELLAILVAGTPLLTAVAERNRQRWLEFTGGAAVLPADAAAIQQWLDQVLPPPGS